MSKITPEINRTMVQNLKDERWEVMSVVNNWVNRSKTNKKPKKNSDQIMNIKCSWKG